MTEIHDEDMPATDAPDSDEDTGDDDVYAEPEPKNDPVTQDEEDQP